MTTPPGRERIDEAVEAFDRIIRTLEERQAGLERGITGLYRLAFLGFTVIVVSLFLLVVILSYQVPQLTTTMADMNIRFASVANDMAGIDVDTNRMRKHVMVLPRIVANMDEIQGIVAVTSGDMVAMEASMSSIDADMARMNQGVADMRQTMAMMNNSIRRMGRDVDRMSTPFQMFNMFNPMW